MFLVPNNQKKKKKKTSDASRPSTGNRRYAWSRFRQNFSPRPQVDLATSDLMWTHPPLIFFKLSPFKRLVFSESSSITQVAVVISLVAKRCFYWCNRCLARMWQSEKKTHLPLCLAFRIQAKVRHLWGFSATWWKVMPMHNAWGEREDFVWLLFIDHRSSSTTHNNTQTHTHTHTESQPLHSMRCNLFLRILLVQAT